MKKILIIEDELVVRSIYRRKFEMAGYQVETAEEGASALKLLPVFRPDVIQVDIMLPGIDGVEVIRQIRSWPDFSSVPILVLSSFYRPDLAKDAWKAGASKCVSKMDCTPNLALELVEQLLSGETTAFAAKFGTIPLPKGVLDALPPPTPKSQGDTEAIKKTGKTNPLASKLPNPAKLTSDTAPPWKVEDPDAPTPAPKLRLSLDLPASTGAGPTRPTLGQTSDAATPGESGGLGKTDSYGKGAAPRQTTRIMERSTSEESKGSDPLPARTTQGLPTQQPDGTPANSGGVSGPDFRNEIRQEFVKRVPLIQAELRDRVGAMIKSKSTADQLKLLHDLEGSVSSLASLAGITGFSRISHLSGALDALIKELHKRPSQMTNSVLRTIAHASDCLNLLFRDLHVGPQEVPQSVLILAVDDEPISRRTISVALSKANLRCIAMEDSKMALTVLNENSFDLIFLDAEMPGLTGFQLCAELRKLPSNKTTPVIFVTSLTKFEIRAQSSLAGGNDLIAKPFLMMELAVKALTYLLKPAPTVEGKSRPAQTAA